MLDLNLSGPLPATARGASTHKAAHAAYRPDIDGLRAVAVLSVLAYHAFPTLVSGGFIGVDIFFIISGFLISGILQQNLENGTFSFRDFYARRIRRIFPSLSVLLITTYAFGWFTLVGDEFAELGKQTFAGAAFVSNLVLWREGGYFDTSADTKLLLHLWSLGIEEQFYIVWPIVLMIGWKWRHRTVALILALIAVSFAMNVGTVERDPIAAFYSPLSRFWELLCGATLAYASAHKQALIETAPAFLRSTLQRFIAPGSESRLASHVASTLGALLLCTAIAGLGPAVSFPGWWALLPTLGAVLIVAGGSHAWPNRFVLSNRVAVWFGLISYPLYLWHWPLLAYARVIGLKAPSVETRVLLLTLAVILAWCTYRFVERPLRSSIHGAKKVALLLMVMSVVGAVGLLTYLNKGMPFRDVMSKNPTLTSVSLGNGQELVRRGCGVPHEREADVLFCYEDARSPSNYAVWGDSKGDAVYWGLVRESEEGKRWMLIGNPGCAPVVGVEINNRDREKCARSSQLALDALTSNRDVQTVLMVTGQRVVMEPFIETGPGQEQAADAPLYGLLRAAQALQAAGKKVVFMIDNPILPDPKDCVKRNSALPLFSGAIDDAIEDNPACSLPLNVHLERASAYRSLVDRLGSMDKAITIYDPTPLLCDSRTNRCPVALQGKLLYSYTDHLSDFGNSLVAKDLTNRIFNRPR